MKYDLIKQQYSSMQQRLINEEYKDIKENYKIKMILYFFASTFHPMQIYHYLLIINEI